MSKEVLVYTTPGQLNADMVVAFLKSNGINCYASMEAAGSVFGVPNSFLGRARIYVLEENEDKARELLTAMEEGEMVLPEDVDLVAAFEGEIEPVDDAALASDDSDEDFEGEDE